ncbi:MAG: glycosyltransferase family 2 protein [Clostridiales bacterium]|nr:glycosyltransferase family 2 protein [Clostridiales bacterium]
MKNTLYIIIPCFNEEEALPLTAEVLLKKLRQLVAEGKISQRSRIMLVDDGSRDTTWGVIERLSADYEEFCGVKLSANRGTQKALIAGMSLASERCDVLVSTDADLQDDINAIDRMVDEYLNGAEIVYGVRSRRKTDTFIKRFTAELYYKVLDWLECGTVFNHSDYRLLSRRAVRALMEYGERDMFIRGILPMVGFKSAKVSYERRERNAGKTKYTVRSLISLATMGITSLSLKPLGLIRNLGVLMVIVAAAFLIVGLIRGSVGIAGAVAANVWFVGGIMTFAIGIVGEYVGRVLAETKKRPRYHIEETINLEETDGRER